MTYIKNADKSKFIDEYNNLMKGFTPLNEKVASGFKWIKATDRFEKYSKLKELQNTITTSNTTFKP